MRIQNNMQAMNTQRMLNLNNEGKGKVLEKLSSGFRINKAGDDAAGLAISEKMRAQIRGLNQASRNSQDAISLIQTAEGATGEVHEILQRMRVLSVQSANDTNVSADREAIQNELDQLISEVDRIANTTEFNGISLLNGSGSGPTVSQSTIDSLTAALPAYLDDAIDMIEGTYAMNIGGPRNLDITYYSDSTTSTGASMGTADGGASLELRVNLANITDLNGSLIPEGYIDTLLTHEVMHAYEFVEMPVMSDGTDREKENWFLEGLAMMVQGGNSIPDSGSNVALTSSFDGDYRSAYEAVKILHEVTNGGINSIIANLDLGQSLDVAIGGATQAFAGTELVGANGAANFADVTDFISWYNANANTDATLMNYIATSNDFTQGTGVVTTPGAKGSNTNLSQDASVTNDASAASATAAFNITFTNSNFAGTGGNLTMQIGANENQDMTVELGNVTTSNLGINSLDLATRLGSESAITSLDSAIETVSNI